MFKLSKLNKIALSSATLSLLFVGNAFAQQDSNSTGSVGIEVSSPTYEVTATPGTTEPNLIKIKNVGNTTETYYPEVLDFKSDNKTGTPVFLKEGQTSGTYSLASWIRISKEPIKLEPGASDARLFYVDVPVGAEPGGHYAGILFSTQAPQEKAGNISLASKVGSIVLVRVAGKATEAAKITEFTSDKQNYETANIKFSTTVKNTGNVHVQPKGVITIKNFFGVQEAAIDVNQLSANVLPDSSRIFSSAWKDGGFKFGYYTASVVLTYGDPSQTTSASVSFWLVPWKTLLILVILIILLVVAVYFAIKRYNAWIIAKAKTT